MFECRIEGAPEPDITWYKDDVQLYPSDDPNLVHHLDGALEIQSIRFSDFGRYYCKAANEERVRSTEVVALQQNGDACE